VRYGDVASGSAFDFGAQQVLSSDPSTLVPSTQAGDYYILIQGRSGANNTPVKLTAKALPSASPTSCRTGRRWPLGHRHHHRCAVQARRDREAGAAWVGGSRAGTLPSDRCNQDHRHVRLAQCAARLYDVAVIIRWCARHPAYRYLIEDALPIDVTIVSAAARRAGRTDGLYSVSLQSLTMSIHPMCIFAFGVPELGDNARVYDLPYVTFTPTCAVRPTRSAPMSPGPVSTARSIAGGFMLAPGYALDVSAGGFVGMSFTAHHVSG